MARVLVPLPAKRQKKLAQAIQDEDLSVRATERRAQKTKKTKSPSTSEPDPDLTRLQQRLSDHLGWPGHPPSREKRRQPGAALQQR